MRGNWDTSEPLVHAPNQQRQQQQQTIVEEQRHPLHSPTTPAWGIADRIVKEEPAEDKNDDSGVSPDHYTSNSASPRSRRSSSTANCSLSPGSATSQDSNNMQCATFEYSPQRMFKNCGSPMEFTRHPVLDEHRQDQTMDVVSSTVKQSNDEPELMQDTLQCPICAFATANRATFTEHLATHCSTKCEAPDFARAILGQLTNTPQIQDESRDRASPTQGERSEHESEETDEPGLRIPRVNSQGKVKTFRCKQCNFVAITKLEFWEHSRGHIKAEKLLTCPKCPFVTEYKHHLEYHLRNHFGSKPFKCDKCSYSCVNKSMLNSHLKSHSNVYQYRCANCSYATKYCHSLKLHLRKYSHQPAMVLNADGSPNPLPIIDVYGTRRGPKTKTVKQGDDQSPNTVTNNNIQTSLPPSPIVMPPQVSPVSHLPVTTMNGITTITPMNGINVMNAMNSINGVSSVASINSVTAANPLSPSTVITFPYNQLFAGFPIPHRFPLLEEAAAEKPADRTNSSAQMDYSKTVDIEKTIEEAPQDLAMRCFGINGGTKLLINGISNSPKPNGVTGLESNFNANNVSLDIKATPLDLSKPETTGNQQQQQRLMTNSPKATGTSRRKGRAVKLERRVVEDDTDDEHYHQQEETTEESFEPPAASSPGSRESKEPDRTVNYSVGNEFSCQYCEIAFGNVVMYTVHMGYHGYKDPYTCNMCGHQCTDKVSFFLHIARSKHS